MRTLFLVPLLWAPCLLPAACNASPTGETTPADPAQHLDTGDDCICGTPRGDLIGCHCEDCLLNGGNPYNPDCMCLPLGVSTGEHRVQASFGGGGRAGSLVGLETIVLRKGGRLSGEVIADDGATIQFKQVDGEVLAVAYDDLRTRDVYKLLKAKTAKDDGPAELRLANYARDIGLYAHSRRHYMRALEADSSLEAEVTDGLASLREAAATAQLALAREAQQAGREQEAVGHLVDVLREFPDGQAAIEAAAMLEDLETGIQEASAAMAAQRQSEQVRRALEPIDRYYERAQEKNRKGLTSGRSASSAVSNFKSAASDAERARKQIARVEQRAGGDEALLAAMAEYAQRVETLSVQIYNNLASQYLVRRDYQSALSSINKAVAIDPDDEDSKQIRSRIETAGNEYRQGYERGYSSGRSSRSALGTYGVIGLGGAHYGYRRGYAMRGRSGFSIGYGGWGR